MIIENVTFLYDNYIEGVKSIMNDFKRMKEMTMTPTNATDKVDINNFLDSNFAILLFSLITAMVWVIYVTYYNSRVIGYIITRLLTKFYVRTGYLNVGSFTVCALSGKIMFRDIVYITHDYTIRIQDGWLIFRWWRSYVPKDVSEDLSHSDTRLSVMLNGLELHIYNRCDLYSKLERTFGLEPSIIPWEELVNKGDVEAQIHDPGGRQQVSIGKSWRDLVPVIKVDISSGRFVFGNRLVPTTLSINVEEAHCVYSTKPAASKLDHFMHFVKCKAENFKVILAPSPKYTGIADEPPRYMGAGFVVFSSNKIELYYYMDEPGVVPEEPEMLQLANGDIVESAPPIWGIDIKCGKGTDFSYGPWADRQREHLFKFFFPQDYQNLEVTKPPQPGEKRRVQAFDIRLSTLYESTIDILFTKNKETNAVHVNVGPGSYLEVTMPWIVNKDGYITKITGQLLHLEATTSLQFRSLVESETLEFTVRCHYPIRWNDHQEWLLNLTGCKATGWFIYAHKDFFEDLINDWASKSKPDLLHFIPYTWKLTVLLKEFELLTQSNEYNWVDCSSQNQENAHIAVCGDLFDFSFDLPFDDFLPQTLPLRFWIQGESVDLAMYLPEVYTSRSIVLSMDKNAKLLSRDGTILHPRPQDNGRKWRNVCKRSNGWIDFWSIPIAALSIHYTYHPMPPFGPPPQADITTPEKEEILLSPMRMPGVRKNPSVLHWSKDGNQKFDPSTLTPDKVSLELEIGPSVMFLYGTCLRHLVHLKESIFGEDQAFTDMNDPPNLSNNDTNNSAATTAADSGSLSEDELAKKEFDPRLYRPLDIVVSITMHDIQAHLMKSCMEKDPPCPIILLERFGFEMKIEYKEMQLQLLLSPTILISTDKVPSRPHRDNHLNQGHMMLSGLQIRGHGMFSDRGRTLEQKTLEYAWMLEIQIGKLSAKLTSPQLYHIVTGVETLALLMFDSENKLRPPKLPQECLHGVAPKQCPESDPDGTYRCPSSNDVKYRMTRCTIDAIDFYLVESNTALNLWASPIRIATCNLHGNHVKSGVTTLIPAIRLRHMVAANSQVCNQHGTGTASNSNTNTTCSGRSQHRMNIDGTDIWLEVGSVALGPLILEAAASLCNSDKNLHMVQHKFLKFHDERYKKLWFLWPSDSKLLVTGRCGCIGGCVFFGRNRNGQRFFKPTRQDIQDGINVVAFRINDSGKDPGFGQSILHESQLVFHTPPYNALDMTIHDQPVPIWTEQRVSSSTSVRSKLTESDNHIMNDNVVASSNSVTDSPSTATTGSSLTPSHNPQFDGKLSLPRRFSYTSTGNRLPNASHINREVPYARLIDSSPTSAFPSTKLDSDSRLNTLGSILSVPENGEYDGTPKSSISDSKLSVDYFNTHGAQSSISDHKDTDTHPHGTESITSLSNSENKSTSPKGEAIFKRTVSLSSENQSDTFFSAEEELSHNRNSLDSNMTEIKSPNSRSSSLRNSVISSSSSYVQEGTLPCKRFGSDLNILPEKNKVLPSSHLNEIKMSLPVHRSDNEIHTPEHRSGYFGRNFYDQAPVAEDEKSLIGSLEHLQRQLIEAPASWPQRNDSPKLKSCSIDDDDTLVQTSASALLLDSSDSRSVSSTSFISAVSSQEDLTLVNLHMQVNKPIVDSPLLMSTYINHLSQVGCTNWSQVSLPPGSDVFTVPFFQRSNDGRLAFISSKYLPKFDVLTEGFTSLKMVRRSYCDSSPAPNFTRMPENSYPWDKNHPDLVSSMNEDFEFISQEELLSLRNESGTRTTIIIKMKGDVDIMVTPLILESLQRFVDALTPTLSILHPITVLNHLHLSCIGKVESANVLKKDKYLSQLQGGGSKRSTVERVKNVTKDSTDTHEPYSVYEEFIASQVQGTVILPKINISVLQASIVEEVISFSALDNLRDLTCVSLLAICIDEVTARFHYGKQAREVVQTFHRPTVTPSGQKKGVLSRAAGKALLLGLHFTTTPGKDNIRGEPVYIETSEKQEQETVITFNISKIHTQLRRLRNECSLLKDAVITAIPSYSSKVLFTTCSKSSASPSNTVTDSLLTENNNTLSALPDDLTTLSEEKMGFIMMECGFEGVSFKLVKRSKFEKDEEQNDTKDGAPEGKSSSPVPASEGHCTNSVRSKEELEASVKHVNETNNEASAGASNAGESESNSQKEQPDKATAGSYDKNDNSGNSTLNKNVDGNASSCIIEIQQVWFNFAAPPRTPITRKIDYTRLDWNLLSTASPAINAWMNPSNRLAIRVVHMLRCRYRRNTAVITCLMAEALDVQSLHMPLKSRYGRITPMAKTLQEDPSCQLCNILRKYTLQNPNIEEYLKDDVPHLSILRQGVIVLSRQWKNILYTPLLLEHNFKSKRHAVKPLNVTFAVPDPEEENAMLTDEGDGDGEGDGEADVSCEECEVTDECAMLLNPSIGVTPNTLRKVLKTPSNKYAPGSSTVTKTETKPSTNVATSVQPPNAATPSTNVAELPQMIHSSPTSPASSGQHVNVMKPGVPPRRKKKSLLPTQQPSSSRASVVFPIASGSVTSSPQHQYLPKTDIGLNEKNQPAAKKPEATAMSPNFILHSCGSVPSLCSGAAGDTMIQHSTGSLDGQNTSPPMVSYFVSNSGSGVTGLNKSGQGEDLYTWMAKQGFEDADTKITESKVAKSTFWDLPKEEIPTVSPAISISNPDYTLLAAAGYSLYPMHDSLRLLDAHLIFEPLLSSLGVMPQQMITNTGRNNNGVTSLDSWGSNLTLVGGMESMRIDIVVSELGKGSFDTDSSKRPKSGKPPTGSKGAKFTEKHSLEMASEIPAFLCERVNLECDVRRVADMTVVEDLSRQRRNMLYVSRGQLKKHSNTALNVSVSAHYISQQVNMPLLRLLHQITNMYQNVKDTQSELKEQEPPTEMKIPPPKPPPPNVDLQSLHVNVPSHVDGKPPVYPYTLNEHKVVISPSSSVRSTRHQSLAQRLRSTSRSVKGYMNLGDGPNTNRSRFSSISDDKMSQIKEESPNVTTSIPKCWKTVYYLLDLYATMPETKTVSHRISMAGDVSDGLKGTRKYDPLIESKSSDDVDKVDAAAPSTPILQHQNLIREEKTRLIIFAVARIHRTKLLATLSGLKLEAEITNLHSSVTCRKKIRPMSLEYSVTGQVGRTMIVLLEGVAPNQQTVVKVTVGKSQALYSSMSRRSKDKNSALLTVGAINIEIPQHPVALHGMMTRGTKQLSSTLQELRVTRTSSRMSRGTTLDEMDTNVGPQPSPRQPVRSSKGNTSIKSHVQVNSSPLLQPLVMHFTAVIQSLSITASLLPSLQAQYKMDQLTSNGFTGSKAKFVVDLPRHSLSFSTKVEVTEANLPSEACIELPKVHVSAEYVQDSTKPKDSQCLSTDGAVLRAGNYLSAVADIGVFEHSLTTDLLNHLMFVQKVFMKEVNEVVQKVYGGEKPVPIWLEDTEESSNTPVKRILFSLIVRIKRIQLTATTPTNCAVRLETGSVEFQISNRVQNVSGASVQPSETAKIFVKTQVDVNLSLGQLIKNVLFEEADPEFQQFAFFKTRIGIRNAFQGEMVGEGEDKEVILITLRRPLIYIQPIAVDKAILVWLNYKNAYEYWNEQRSILNSEVLSATQQIYERIALERLTSSSSSGILFLQLTVEDMGICVPLNPLPPTTWGLNRSFMPENDSCAAVVITLESTSISACSAGSLVSKGRFIGLCLRFADDFETSLDDWKPDINNELAGVLMNFCSVSEGTYEVCSRTTTQKSESENPKWFLNVQWQMEGVDIHLDVNIGKQLSALGHTLTMLTGVQEDETLTACCESDEGDDNTNNSQESLDSSKNIPLDDTLFPLVNDGSMDSKKRSKLLEKQMYEQVKIINDLRSLGASQGTIEQEVKYLHELETLVFRGFRRDMIQKLRRQSVKGKYQLKDKFGLGTKGTYRSKSFILSSPTKEQAPKIDGSEPESKESTIEEEAKLATIPRVTFSESRNVRRQVSLPSTSSDLSLSMDEKEPMNWLVEQDAKSEDLSNADDDRQSTAESSTLLEDLSNREQLKNGSVSFSKPQEPNIDFELDVKVFINSGKCVLHTKDQTREDELKMISRMKKDRSSSGGTLEFPGSPCVSRRSHKEKQPSYSRLRLNPNTVTPAQIVELTIFHIPGLDVKVHYESKIIPDGSLSPCYTVDSSGMIVRKTNAKKASLFAWLTLQSIPEETIISPHILEFLEQTLEPIPANLRNPLHFTNSTDTSHLLSNSEEDDDIFARYITSGQYAYASFPVDVIVYFHMQPSTFRFSCLPVSRVECMLKLPSLDIVFSSKRADSFNEHETKQDGNMPVAVGGLSVTGVMADFSLYIFHPYGGKKSGSALKDAQTIWSPLADGERKDSLSVNVEFVKFHLSRSRKMNFETPTGKSTEQSHATIRFSTIVDIGSASFKYDMRRLTEILAFPKAWYRRSIIRRLFLGDLTRAPVFSDGEDESGPDHSEEHDHESGLEDERGHGRGGNDKNPKPTSSREKIKRQESKKSHHKGKKKRGSVTEDRIKQHKLTGSTGWQTLVLFAVNFKRLNVHMNMGNVMGNVMWLTKEFHSEGRLSIGSTGHKNLFIGLGFGGSSLDAKGGIVGGTFELSKIDTFISIHEDPGREPDHTVGLKLFALELRLDYMGTAILMSRVSSLNISLRDEWKVVTRKSSGDVLNSTKRPGMVFMHGDLNWDQLQIMISKSTAADLIKMYYKLEEFFSQQFKSSKRVFSSLQDGPRSKSNSVAGPSSSSFRKRGPPPKKKVGATLSDTAVPKSTGTPPESAQHHRHWQPGLCQVANMHLSTMKHALPSWGTVLGGTMDLHGTNISLACFHGINFKSKSWALFSLKEPCISFATEAQEVEAKEPTVLEKDVHIVETLTFSLGMTPNMQTYTQHHSMATICRVSRNVLFPPQFRTIQEWFHYAFSCSEIDAVDRFPSLERERLESVSDGVRCRTPKPQETVNHTREVIFALPSLQLHLKTEHLQAAIPCMSDEKPLVDCSFITEFEDHIFVTVDAEAFFFLHDLITSYMREKERVSASQSYHRAYSPSPPEPNKKKSNSSNGQNGKSDQTTDEIEEHYSKDWRSFQCKTWHLEPTVRLLSWGGKSIEPYGVDYILQKLGFSHARTTIPKWMQRGFMDPLDKVLAVLVLRIIALAREEPKHDAKKSTH